MSRVPFIAIARGLVRCGDKYVLCRAKGYDFWFLPGGGIEDGEDARLTLKREAIEEMGLELGDLTYVTTLQNRYPEKGVMVNELCIVFEVDIAAGTKVVSLEEHIEVGLFNPDEIRTIKILPATLKQALVASFDGTPISGFISLES